ncbi:MULTISPECIES: ATP-binding cassette domain-containing protein [unclassified Leptolyngbya]|uniref:ABC transporter ATP-binding protein n=1 Tax=unclassified Leptolyngbya TaxID=2650499 RepID=UPI00168A0A11|nr:MULTISPECIES: ATP-binding cassette domain-containing protein [unclassified Leptolyngbya]MBD1910026.1 ATP-binding cassette domain-containing protein [Leptolyngbya sp. FACHB-8]MBD2156848.1 ATP-binding cassette domain-containing protein [Leptolyngbya sp. FACHB-16]
MAWNHNSSYLQIHNLTKRYDNNAVLKGVNLEVMPGEFVAIVGRSGCGKSTLLRLLAGLEKPSQGQILVNGQPVNDLNGATRVMFQNARLLPWKRVLDNVGMGLLHHRRDWRKRAEYVLHQVGLGEKVREYPAFLSGGQRQRVALARALASNPSLLLLDEPLSALDALTRLEMQRLVEELWQAQQFTTLLVTHDIQEAVLLGDRIVLIDQGQIALEVVVSLPRPRDPGHPEFTATVQQILKRVMSRTEETLVTNDLTLGPLAEVLLGT